jgi:uncharacterized membrane protein (UPF0127 family)
VLQHRVSGLARFVVYAVAALALASGAACAQVSPAQVGGPGCIADGPPQTTLPREVLTIHTARGPVRFNVQVAADDASRTKGLMFVRSMPDDEGMLFDFHQPQSTAFWMRNTYLPLDLLFVTADGRIANIAHRAPTCSDAPIPGEGPIRVVIEINAGLAERLGIQPGDRVSGERTFPAS